MEAHEAGVFVDLDNVTSLEPILDLILSNQASVRYMELVNLFIKILKNLKNEWTA